MRGPLVVVLILAGIAMTGAVFAGGDPAAGKAKTKACSGCHGEDGNSEAPSNPRLAGQHERYLVDAIKAYKFGNRTSFPIHESFVRGFNDQEIRDIAAYYAAQPYRPEGSVDCGMESDSE